jgi:hypothetical protein
VHQFGAFLLQHLSHAELLIPPQLRNFSSLEWSLMGLIRQDEKNSDTKNSCCGIKSKNNTKNSKAKKILNHVIFNISKS